MKRHGVIHIEADFEDDGADSLSDAQWELRWAISQLIMADEDEQEEAGFKFIKLEII